MVLFVELPFLPPMTTGLLPNRHDMFINQVGMHGHLHDTRRKAVQKSDNVVFLKCSIRVVPGSMGRARGLQGQVLLTRSLVAICQNWPLCVYLATHQLHGKVILAAGTVPFGFWLSFVITGSNSFVITGANCEERGNWHGNNMTTTIGGKLKLPLQTPNTDLANHSHLLVTIRV